MTIKGKVLGVSTESFTNKETGEKIVYKRLHLWDPIAWEYFKLPIRGEIVDRKLAEIEFGAEIEVPVGQREAKNGGKELAVIQWE